MSTVNAQEHARPSNPHHMQIWRFWKTSPEKPGNQDLKPGDFKNMRQIKTATTDNLFQSSLLNLLVDMYSFAPFLHFLSGCLCAPAILWWRRGSRSHQDTQGWRLSPALLPLPSQISFDELNLAVMSTDFSIFLHAFRIFWQFKAHWFTARLRGKTVRLCVGIPNRESHGQTVRVGRSGHLWMYKSYLLLNPLILWKQLHKYNYVETMLACRLN